MAREDKGNDNNNNNNIVVIVVIVVVVVLSHLHCRVVRHARMGGQGRWWGSESERAIAISGNTWPRVWVRVRVPTSCTRTRTLWIPVPKTLAGQPYLCYCLLLHYDVKLSTAYHPQTDGQTK